MNQYVIEHLKSGISINSHIGCSLKCKYCILSHIKSYPKQPQMVEHPESIIKKLFNSGSLYVRDKTPLFINNRTDPFLPQVIESTYHFLDCLSVEEIQSPIVIITKLSPDERIMKYFSKLNILFMYTYTALPMGYDYNSNYNINQKNMMKIKEYVPYESRFHYYRPIIPGMNDTEECFEQAIEQVGQYCRSTIIGGIRIINDIMNPEKKIKNSKEHKILDQGCWSNIRQLSKRSQVNIVRHTSCAISIFMNKKVKLNYFDNPEHCHKDCSNYDICCKCEEVMCFKEIESYLQTICNGHFTFDNNTVFFSDDIQQEVVSALKCAYGLNVQAKRIVLSPSEESLMQ